MKKRITCGVLSAVILFLLFVPMFSLETRAAEEYEYAWFPAPTMNLTQIAYESYSHGSQNAIDFVPGGNVFAPFTGKIVYLDEDWGYAVLQSTNKVYYADGTLDYMTVAFMHDENIGNLSVGQIIKQGKTFYQAGGMGDGNPNAYGDHVHLSVHKGKSKGITNGKYGRGDVFAFDALFVNSKKTTSIKNPGKKESGNTVGKGAPTNWKNLWIDLEVTKTYLWKCTSYPAHCTIKANAATGAMSLPCSSGTNSESEMLLSIAKGETFTATELILNDQGNHWYKIKTPDGKTAYTPSSKMDYVDDLLTDIKITSPKAPTTLKKGNVFSIEGTVKSTYNDLTKVGAYVYKGTTASGDAVTGGSATVNGTSYSLKGSTVDSKVLFNELGTGTYTYAVYAHYKNYYAKDEKTSATNTGKVCVYTATFKVTSSSTSCSHSYSSKVTTKATCTKNGVKTFTCSKCNASYTESIAATGHSYGSWQTAKNPTCVAEGYKEKICANCGDIQTQAIAATGHSWNAATCTTAKKCKTCDATEGSALGHSWNAATCTAAKKCKTCGATEGSALGHSWNAATCTTAKKCKTCGATEGSSLGHSWNAATCTTAKKCKTCGATEGSALGHSWNAATCTTAKKCKTCGATEGSALGHSWKEATCSVPKTCATCGATSGNAKGHDWAAGNCTTPKKCKTCGTTNGGVVHTYDSNFDYKCNVCGVERTVDMTRPMVDMFRMYDPNSGEHFYTGSVEEKNNLIAVGWQYEGVGFTFPLTTGDPVHRLYDPVYGEHLYTMDVEEMNALLAAGWLYEGIAFNSGFENEVPQYRLHNPNATRGAYHFTASLEERDMLMALGWEYQGIGWYSLGA